MSVRVEISEAAARELRERMPTPGTMGLMIQPGPLHEEYFGPEWSDEEVILAPLQRWLFLLMEHEAFDDVPSAPGAVAFLQVRGIRVLVVYPPASGVLRVELVDDAIRIQELDE